ncbi:efflux RND transporter periplasmic adaptor subunit [Oryzifoliimicrobium ureilyticus]|uniref:efflux RND transporter periplasmic adaptor subunit n=1 Tax=Oryzifoliimicrobium ureilyticus TaxID=3113724 RepID=UPI0030763900
MHYFRYGLILMGCALILASCQKQEAAEGKKPTNVIAVKVDEKPQTKAAMVTGDVRARIQSELSFRVSGRIVERFVDVGSRVKAGDLLARLDAEEQLAEVAVEQANLEAAKAQETQAQLALQRQESLFQTQVTTRAALDEARQNLTTAHGTVVSAQAQYDTAKDALSYTELRADADGIITARNAEAGQVAQAATSVFSLAHDGPRDAVFDVFEALYLGQKPEGNVTVALISDPTRKVLGHIWEISPTIDTTKGTIKVKVALDEKSDLPLGAPVVGTFQSHAMPRMQVPWSALTSLAGRPAVWVLDSASSTVAAKPIEIASYQTDSVLVQSGLNKGDLVVSDGLKFLHEGQKVTYQEAHEK